MTSPYEPKTAAVDDGGPAFPCVTTAGMSLRDWFAGQALAGMLAYPAPGAPIPRVVAKAAYEYADAMIAERGKQDD